MSLKDLASGVLGTSNPIDLAFGVYDRFKQEERYNKSYNLNKKSMTHKYRYAMADMKAAGLNPILAAGGISGGNAAPAVPGSVGQTNYGEKAASAKALKSATEKTNMEKFMLQALESKHMEDAMLAAASTALTAEKIATEKEAREAIRLENAARRAALNKTRLKGKWWEKADTAYEGVVNPMETSGKEFDQQMDWLRKKISNIITGSKKK